MLVQSILLDLFIPFEILSNVLSNHFALEVLPTIFNPPVVVIT